MPEDEALSVKKVRELCKQLTPVELEHVKKYHTIPNRLSSWRLSEKEKELLVEFCKPIDKVFIDAMKKSLGIGVVDVKTD